MQKEYHFVGDDILMTYLFEFSEAGLNYNDYDVLFEIIPNFYELHFPPEISSDFLTPYVYEEYDPKVPHSTKSYPFDSLICLSNRYLLVSSTTNL